MAVVSGYVSLASGAWSSTETGDTLQIEIENSLRRLEVDCIDLYQTHWPSAPPDQTPIADTMAVLLKLKEQGKIRAIGVSNVSLDELRENARCGGIASDQFRYSMLHREAENEQLPRYVRYRTEKPIVIA